MKLAKIFRHGGSQAVRLPKAFRFEGSAVGIERQGNTVVLTPRPSTRLGTLGEVARHLSSRHPGGGAIEAPKRAARHERSAPSW